MFATILGFAPLVINFAMQVAGQFLSPKNAQYAGHAANLIIQGLSLAERLQQAHAEGRDITDAEIAGATAAAAKAADEFTSTLERLKAARPASPRPGPSEVPIG
ncbi:MAG: hypothetical protein ACE5JZ_03000 [Kiloniellales bacterium]